MPLSSTVKSSQITPGLFFLKNFLNSGSFSQALFQSPWPLVLYSIFIPENISGLAALRSDNFLAAVPVKLPFHISETFLAKTSVSIDLPLYFFKNLISSSTRACCSALLGIRPPGS